jgi:hypothetical protein
MSDLVRKGHLEGVRVSQEKKAGGRFSSIKRIPSQGTFRNI